MPGHKVAEHVGFVIRRVADSVVIPVAPGVIAPIIASSVFCEGVRTLAALRRFKRRLPDLLGVPDESISNKHVLFGAVAEVEVDVVGGDDISLKTVLVRLLDEKASILAGDDVAPNCANPGVKRTTHPRAAIISNRSHANQLKLNWRPT